MAKNRSSKTLPGRPAARPGRPNRRRSAPPAEPERPKLPPSTRAKLAWLRVQSRLLRFERPFRWCFRAFLLAGVSLAGLSSGRLVEAHVRSTETFAISTLQVSGRERLSRQEVLKTAGLSLGQNAFEVSPERAQARLLEHPWIAEAVVRRRLPASYSIEVRERGAAALLALDEIFLIGDDGSLFKALEPGDPGDLPVVTGVDAERFTADAAFRASLLVNVVALLHDYRDAGLWRREPIAEVHAGEEGFALYVGEDATLVRLGKPPFRQKLHRLRGVLNQLEGDNARPAYVYLDNIRRPDRVTVRLR